MINPTRGTPAFNNAALGSGIVDPTAHKLLRERNFFIDGSTQIARE
jgi:hypothetical protein